MIICEDCQKYLATMEADSIDSVVTDPPYELGFMSKDWDKSGVSFDPEIWSAVLRVTKSGACMVAFGGTRTHHRIMCAIEDAGWELRDTLCWLQGQGFPKSKALLKPAWEPIILARKPGPLCELGIDQCRAGTVGGETHSKSAEAAKGRGIYGSFGAVETDKTPRGRWPSNVVLSHNPPTATSPGCQRVGMEEVEDWRCEPSCPVALLDAQAGERKGAVSNGKRKGSGFADNWGVMKQAPSYADTGSASRFFPVFGPDDEEADRFLYSPKASRSEREAGTEALRGWINTARGLQYKEIGNDHPTVKPIQLMRWLVRLITPENGTVLDPFSGSGSTGIAAILENRQFIGIDNDSNSVKIARARMVYWEKSR